MTPLRRRILEWLRDHQDERPPRQLLPERIEASDIDPVRFASVVHSLFESGWIDGIDASHKVAHCLLEPRITPAGLEALAPPAPTAQTFQISGGNVQIGDGNTQNVDARVVHLIESIRNAEAMTEEEKSGAFARLREFLRSPGLGNALQGTGVLVQMLGG